MLGAAVAATCCSAPGSVLAQATSARNETVAAKPDANRVLINLKLLGVIMYLTEKRGGHMFAVITGARGKKPGTSRNQFPLPLRKCRYIFASITMARMRCIQQTAIVILYFFSGLPG